MNCVEIDNASITFPSTHAGRSKHALALPPGHLVTSEQRRSLLQSECVFVRSGERVVGQAAYNIAYRRNRMVHHVLVDRSLAPSAARLVLDILIMSLEMTALRDEISSLTLVVPDRAFLSRLAVHGYFSVVRKSHEVWVQKTVRWDSGDVAA